jgi:hypothetical protein
VHLLFKSIISTQSKTLELKSSEFPLEIFIASFAVKLSENSIRWRATASQLDQSLFGLLVHVRLRHRLAPQDLDYVRFGFALRTTRLFGNDLLFAVRHTGDFLLINLTMLSLYGKEI